MRFSQKSKKFQDQLTATLPAVWRYALALTGKPDLADELSQATALRALESKAQFTTGSVEAWCITICRSIWLNEKRAQAVKTRHAISSIDENALQSLFSPTETNIFASEVFTKVMQLPEAQRETVVLVYVNGFSYREAADILDIPIGTIMSRLAAARSKIVVWADGKEVRQQ